MKKYLFGLLLGCICCSGIHAQAVKVHIQSDGLNLPFAYIFINEKFYSSADSIGTALIPRRLLKDGDAVSAEYVGAKETAQIYNGQDEITLNLPGLDIEAITVLSRAKRKDFWQNINQYKIRKAYQKIACRFEIHENDDTTKITKGRAKYYIRPVANADGYEIVGNVSDLDNRANLSQATIDLTKLIVNEAFVAVCFKKGISTNKGIQILREKSSANNQAIYTIIRPAVSADNSDMESMKIFVDVESRNITRAIEGWETKTYKILYTIDYRVADDYYIPSDIACRIVYKTGDHRTLCLHIYDLQLDTKRDRNQNR
ncbi:hypothetical protein [Alistipes sp.]|uniref:hypothetical protein n=1 Tax=Alistipes sp. TaxID=1872444 RepID=UPI003AF151AE